MAFLEKHKAGASPALHLDIWFVVLRGMLAIPFFLFWWLCQ